MRTRLYIGALFISLSGYASQVDSADIVPKKKIYHVNHIVVASITGVGLFSDYFAISRIKNKPAISEQELANLNTSIINPIDRWALHQDPSQQTIYRHLADYGQIPLILMPGLLAINNEIRKDWGDILLMYAEGHTITFSFYNYSFLGPTFNNEYRPQTYYTQLPLSVREEGYNRSSFYSGHTASSAYSTFFMAKVYCDYHPEMTTGKYLWYAAAALPPLAIGYFRIRSLDHFPSDVAVGYMLGSSLGIIIPELHKLHSKRVSLDLYTAPDGIGLNIHWRPDRS
jgi:hypothetical protein